MVPALNSFLNFVCKHRGVVTLIIKYRSKGGKITAVEVVDASAHEVLADYLEAAVRRNVQGTERPLWTCVLKVDLRQRRL
jgi:hypothetical protein